MFKTKEIIIRRTLNFILILVPFLLVLGIGIYHNMDVFSMKPAWGDEKWWWQQANAVAEYGRPLGYWGYNGGNPKVSSFATWGPAMVMPYGIYANFFGWEFYSYIFANIFWLSIATGIFVVLLKPDIKSLVLLIVSNITMVVKNLYAITAMAESVRYALGIIAITLLLRFYMKKDSWGAFKKSLLLLFLFYTSQAYLLYSLFFFFFLMIALDKVHIWKRSLISGIGFSILCLLSRWFLRLFSSPYIGGANMSMVEKIFVNLNGLKTILFSGGWFAKSFLFIYIILLFLIPIILLKKKKTICELDYVLYIGAEVILLAFLGGHVVLYNTTEVWTLIRGLSVGLVLVVFLLCLAREKSVAYIYVFCSFLLIINYKEVATIFVDGREQTKEWKQTVNASKADLEQVLIMETTSGDPWDNTVATYNVGGLEVTLSLPVGFSVNAMLNGNVNTNVKYSVVGKKDNIEYAENQIRILQENGYVKSLENERMAILVNQKEVERK